jgi:TM2 domain-containing membrane protein YozV
MGKAWQKLNLEGGGLQAVNALLAQQMRSRLRAYVAWILFPLGLHRFYLAEPRGGLAFLVLSLLVAVTAWLAPAWWWLLPLAVLLGLAMYDLFWIDRRVVRLNKELRMQLFLRKGKTPPRDYRGRYSDAADSGSVTSDLEAYQALKEQERAGHAPPEAGKEVPARKRLPSFNEQEAMLRELAKRKKKD